MLKGTAHPGGVQSHIPQISVETTPLFHNLLKRRSQSFDLERPPETRPFIKIIYTVAQFIWHLEWFFEYSMHSVQLLSNL